METGNLNNKNSPAVTSSPSQTKSPPVQLKNCSVYKFVSLLDGKEDCYALRAVKKVEHNSNNKTTSRNQIILANNTLLIYLHSLTGDFSEVFRSDSDSVLADVINKEFPSLSILSCNYGKSPSWGNAIARMDITSNLHKVIKELSIKHIVLLGTSMGPPLLLPTRPLPPVTLRKKLWALSQCVLVQISKISTTKARHQK